MRRAAAPICQSSSTSKSQATPNSCKQQETICGNTALAPHNTGVNCYADYETNLYTFMGSAI